ncbi:TRAP transporter large permease [Pontivivens nitratireducens]|uniref:TRAP transporter large permease protein n=1 Tax=Pontivivens nitratireducens TaxID=2758038 RepID=A0A6G7VRN9_9RHOB|nr:TRAP transporter large permease [Pontibrevibacter nitratireducens]QIK42590.1 TRAP transporter large permease [Pontibrevibacter nitratireducens]
MIALGTGAFVLLILLIVIGVPIGLSLIAVGIGGLAIVGSLSTAMTQITLSFWSEGTKFVLIAIPFYILMGNLIYHTGIARNMFRAASYWLSWMPGGLAIAAVFACAGFGAVSGSSTATARTMGAIIIPEMRRYGYGMPLSTGVLSASGTLGILIPPSIIMIFYGLMTETSIGALFVAGVVPGLIIALIFATTIVLIVRIDPDQGGHQVAAPALAERVRALLGVLPVLGLFTVLLGGLYLGVFTPTEGSVIGVFVVLVLGFFQRSLSFDAIRASLTDAALMSTMLFVIIVGGTLFTRFLVQTGLIEAITGAMLAMDLGYFQFIFAVTLLYLVLGCVLDVFGMLILTVPILYPIAMALGIDPVWFGIYVIIVAEIGLVTPPLGVNVYVIKTVAQDVPLGKIFLGCMPFVVGILGFIGLLAVFPQIALFLVE